MNLILQIILALFLLIIKLTNLKYLDFRNNNIRDIGAKYIRLALSKLNKLNHLDLRIIIIK